MRALVSGALLAALAACGKSSEETEHTETAAPPHSETETETEPPVDADGDGAPAGEDCDDADGARYPGAVDVARDGVDQDCDGVDRCSGAPVVFTGDLVVTDAASADPVCGAGFDTLSGDLSVRFTSLVDLSSVACLCGVGGDVVDGRAATREDPRQQRHPERDTHPPEGTHARITPRGASGRCSPAP